jgi:enoyl-CoA hydratase/carnithine racemase
MPVLYERRNHVGWLTLSRPEARNAWGEDFTRIPPMKVQI